MKCSDALSDYPLQGRSNAVAAAHCKKGTRYLFQNDNFHQEKNQTLSQRWQLCNKDLCAMQLLGILLQNSAGPGSEWGWGQVSAAVKPFCQVQEMTKAHFQGQLCVVTEAVISANLSG